MERQNRIFMEPDFKKELELFLMAVKHINAARKIFKDLEDKKSVSGNDNHIGDIGEFYVALFFQLEGRQIRLSDKKNSLYDLEVLDESMNISVKTMTSWSKSKKGSPVKNNDKDPWTHLAAIMLNDMLEPESLAIIPFKELNKKEVFIRNEANRNGEKKTKSYPAFQMWPWLKDYEMNIKKL